MNRFISVGLAVTVAPAILLGIGRFAGSEDVITVSEIALYKVALPIGAVSVAFGVLSVTTKGMRGRRPMTNFDGILLAFISTLRSGLVSVLARCRTFGTMSAKMVRRASHGQWLLMSIALCLITAFLPFASGTPGWVALFFGWIAFGSKVFAWLAIPLLFLSWLFLSLKYARIAVVFASGALLLAVPLLGRPKIISGWGEFMHSEPFTPHIGYFIWLTSIVCSLTSGLKACRSRSTSEPNNALQRTLEDSHR